MFDFSLYLKGTVLLQQTNAYKLVYLFIYFDYCVNLLKEYNTEIQLQVIVTYIYIYIYIYIYRLKQTQSSCKNTCEANQKQQWL